MVVRFELVSSPEPTIERLLRFEPGSGVTTHRLSMNAQLARYASLTPSLLM
jgi:hypothetical protein